MSVSTLADYRRITKDNTSFDGDVNEGLIKAQSFVESETDRYFDLEERTESLKLHSDGRVYPFATPVVSVSSPAEATVSFGSILWTGDWTAQIDPAPLFPQLRPRLLVTYEGGYDDGEAPEDLRRLICLVAQADLKEQTVQVPVGASNVKVGDIAYSGSYLGLASYSPLIWNLIKKWKRREL